MKAKQITSSEIIFRNRWQKGMRINIAYPGVVLFLAILLWMVGSQKSFAQGVGISEASIVPHASSILELKSTSRGFLAPRMTTGERDAITAPATGLLIYNTTTNAFNYYNAGWIPLLDYGTGITSINGTANRISIGGTPAIPTIDIAGTYAGQTSITTLGTISTGTWNGSVISIAYGGTGSSTQNFVDLTTNQTAAGAKTWSNLGTFNLGLTTSGATVNINDNSNFATNINTGTSTGTVTIGGNAVQQIDIAAGTGVQTINLGTGATGSKTINIGTGAISNSISIGFFNRNNLINP